MSTTPVTVFDGVTGAVLEQYDAPAPAREPVTDVAALAEELTAQRARLDAAEDALDHLILASLDADLGGL